MKLGELLIAHPPAPDFSRYCRPIRPPLEAGRLRLTAHVGDAKQSIRTPTEGDASLLISYKNKEGTVMSLAEQNNGAVWSILQLQGASSPKSYRVATGLGWKLLYVDTLRALSSHPDADVDALHMPPWYRITNLTDAQNYEGAQSNYAHVAQALGMRLSEELDCYVVDVRRDVRDLLRQD